MIQDVLRMAKYFPVFPCRHKDEDGEGRKKKSPLVSEWRTKATQDAEQIKKWWQRWPSAWVGMPTGSRSGIVAVDLDEHRGQRGADLIPLLPERVETLSQTTPRPGLHLLFKWNADKPIYNSTGRIHAGIDTRGEGGYIIVAPSPGYKFHGKLRDLADFPDSYYELLKQEPQAPTASEDRRTAPPEDVISLLQRLPVDQYATYDAWIRVLMMCHHASNGDESVREAFKAWSAGDELQHRGSETDGQIDYAWARAKTDRANDRVLTIASLELEVRREHGVVVAPAAVAAGTPVSGFEDIEYVPADGPSLQRKKDGSLKINYHNALILTTAKQIRGVDNPLLGLFAYNQLSYRSEFTRTPPWAEGQPAWRFEHKPIVDDHLTNLLAWISHTYKSDFSLEIGARAMDAAARRNAYHPVQRYLQKLKWDGQHRIDSWLTDYLQVKNTTYTRAAGRRWLVGAVCRAMEPGCKMDYMLVLEGEQGIRKTTALQILGGQWYRSPSLKTLGDKESIVNILGAWIIEIEEMAAVKGTSIDELKKFITGMTDSIRLAYDKFTTDIPRGCVLSGTINPVGDNHYIHDSTGGRRFWPITCQGRIDTGGLESVRDQLWAEAYYAYAAGEKGMMNDSEEGAAKIEQQARMDAHPWMEIVAGHLLDGEGADCRCLTTNDIWTECLGRMPSTITSKDQHSIGRVMKALGWKRTKTSAGKRVGDPPVPNQRNVYMRPGAQHIASEDLE